MGAAPAALFKEEIHPMLQISRKAGWIGFLALLLAVGFSTSASAQMREFIGQIDKINNKKLIVDNRMGDKVSFERVDDTVVEGEKSSWDDLGKKDWVIVSWKFIDKPRKAYKVTVIPPRDEVGEDVD
jgi:hypothetical protein